jgi:hypothetical protein
MKQILLSLNLLAGNNSPSSLNFPINFIQLISPFIIFTPSESFDGIILSGFVFFFLIAIFPQIIYCIIYINVNNLTQRIFSRTVMMFLLEYQIGIRYFFSRCNKRVLSNDSLY